MPSKKQAAASPAPTPAAFDETLLRIEYMPLADLVLRRHPLNAKDHDLGAIDESMDQFGYVTPGVIDERTGLFAEGHGRLDTLVARKDQKRPPPERVVERDGDWYVPVYRGVAFKSDAHLMAFLIASNRTTILGGWDDPKLLANLQKLAAEAPALFAASGFDEDDVRGLILDLKKPAGADGDAPPPKLDQLEEMQAKWGAKLGDLWLIPSKNGGGVHRLLCGDSTNEANVSRALGDCAPFLMETDPPYGVNYDPQWRADYDVERFGVDYNHHVGTVQNDDVVNWEAALKLFTGDVMYVWHAGIFAPEVGMGIKACQFDIRAQIIWRKPSLVMGRGAYHWQHEPMFYAVRKGKKANWNGDRTQSTMWDMQNLSGTRKDKDSEDQSTGHSTQKPIEGYRRPINNHTVPGEYVYDPFNGSGTCLAACELTGRFGIGIEIDPRYVSITLERLSEMGLIPELVALPDVTLEK